jgi:hypothetical protein
MFAGLLAALIGAAVLMLATRSIMGHLPLYDEMLHVTAAQGVLSTGEPTIGSGQYSRAELFTRMVAKSFEIQGVSLETARTPARIAGVLLVAVLGFWVACHAGLLAGISAAVLFASMSSTIELSAFARFYTLHALFAIVSAMAVYEVAGRYSSRMLRLVLLIAAVVAATVAMHLQPTTVIAVGAMVLAVVVVLLYDHWTVAANYFRAHRSVVVISATVGCAVAAVLVWQFDLLAMAGEVPLWGAGNANRIQFYVVLFAKDMPMFWPMFLPAVVLAALTQPRLTLYCTVLFLSAVAVHSVAAAKAERYVFYALPFMFAVWGMAVGGAMRLVRDSIAARTGATRPLASCLAAVLLGFVALNSQELQRAARLVLAHPLPSDAAMFADAPNWSLAVPVLRSIAADSRIVSSGVKAVYYLGDYNYELNSSVVLESESGEEFGRDSRTGRHVISSPGSLSKVLDQAPTTLVVIEQSKLNTNSGVPAPTVNVLKRRCNKITLPSEARLAAWTCSRTG